MATDAATGGRAGAGAAWDGTRTVDGGSRLGGIEDFELYVNDDPTGTLADVEAPEGNLLHIVGV